MSISNCCFSTCIQISQEAGKVVWYSHLFNNFPVCCDPHSQSQWSISSYFLEFSCIVCDPVDVGNLNSGSFAFSKSSLYTWNFFIYILLKSNLKDFEHNLASMWNKHNCMVSWTFFGIAILWDWNEYWPFPVLWPLLSFSKFSGILSAALSQHRLSEFEIAQLECHHLH